MMGGKLFWTKQVRLGLYFNESDMVNYIYTQVYTTMMKAHFCFVYGLWSVGQLMVDQLIVGTTGRTALGWSLMKPEPHNSCVVLFTCR